MTTYSWYSGYPCKETKTDILVITKRKGAYRKPRLFIDFIECYTATIPCYKGRLSILLFSNKTLGYEKD